MVTDTGRDSNNRPYPPPSNVVSVLQRLRSRNLPEQIDAEFLRDANIPEGTINRTLLCTYKANRNHMRIGEFLWQR